MHTYIVHTGFTVVPESFLDRMFCKPCIKVAKAQKSCIRTLYIPVLRWYQKVFWIECVCKPCIKVYTKLRNHAYVHTLFDELCI